jgi:VWFA-related protein
LKSFNSVLCIAVVLLALSSPMQGQQNPWPAAAAVAPNAQSSRNSEGVLTLHAATHLVVLDVVVTDKKGHTVGGLSKDAFTLLEDGHPQSAKFFEEHAPVDPALLAKEKAELAARLPLNTFTTEEPFTGNPVTVLLLNKLTSLPGYDIDPLRLQMIDVIYKAQPETPFVVYQLDSQLRLVQPVTENRDLLLQAVNQMWQEPYFGVPLQALGATDLGKSPQNLNEAAVLARRKVFTAAMQQLSASFGPAMGRKTIFTFTGGLRCTLSSDAGCENGYSPGLKTYLCGVMDMLEQARISMYRYYPGGQVIYGFGCNDAPADLRDIFDTNAHYYTFYYTPTNPDWSGKYRKVKVAIADKHLRLSYRGGYYGHPENAAARHDGGGDAPGPITFGAKMPSADEVSASAMPTDPAPEGAATPSGAPANPMPVVFTVKVEPAAAPGTGAQVAPPSPGNPESEAERRQGYRDYTLHFFVAAAGLRLVRELRSGQAPAAGAYAARLEIAAVSYVHGHPADAKSIQVSANFDGLADPRIAKGEITASLTLQVPEKGHRLLHVTVRDLFGGQFGRLDIPVQKIVLPPQ